MDFTAGCDDEPARRLKIRDDKFFLWGTNVFTNQNPGRILYISRTFKGFKL